ncbi:hypothetical protein N018_25550 [Pseudomonas syringae CC1557]|uniref:Uncharacterized protein n=1 Tax=Pseudomonas syringae CC1557 TaxID=1357279 RepID=W0N3P1_PSESX|nr:hypothetical protein N018_25550 [Pseudomonas syringae CC1557]
MRSSDLNYLNYRATLRVGMPFRTLRILFAAQSVENRILARLQNKKREATSASLR